MAKKNDTRGGRRPRAGRPPKENQKQITIFLRKDTVKQLKKVGGQFYGALLQWHLDQHPLPSREVYLAMTGDKPRQPIWRTIAGRAGGYRLAVRDHQPKKLERPVRKLSKLEKILAKQLPKLKKSVNESRKTVRSH